MVMIKELGNHYYNNNNHIQPKDGPSGINEQKKKKFSKSRVRSFKADSFLFKPAYWLNFLFPTLFVTIIQMDS